MHTNVCNHTEHYETLSALSKTQLALYAVFVWVVVIMLQIRRAQLTILVTDMFIIDRQA